MTVELTYSLLVEYLKNYTDRGYSPTTDPKFYDQIPGLIFLAQDRLSKEAKELISRAVVSNALTLHNPILSKPTRWRNTESFTIMTGPGFNKAKPLFLRPLNYCQTFWPDPTQFGEPKFYADYDLQHWLIVPTPDQAYPLEVKFQQEDQPLDDSNQVNFFTRYAPALLTHACLLEAAIFLKNDQMMAREQTYYDRLLQGEEFQDKMRDTDKSQTKGRGAS